jgi:hypothetical protein
MHNAIAELEEAILLLLSPPPELLLLLLDAEAEEGDLSVAGATCAEQVARSGRKEKRYGG